MTKSTDKFLIFFILVIVAILAITFIIIFKTPEPTYTEENNPEAVVFNYLLALKKADYEKAWSYLSPSLEEYPKSAEEFSQFVIANTYSFDLDDFNEDFILNVEQTKKTKVNATVQVAQTRFYSSGLFYRDERTSYFDMYLRYENDEWKIKDGENYWLNCWSEHAIPCKAYTEENNPEAVVFNYLLALKKADYEKAWSYLSPSLEEYPKSAEEFSQFVIANTYDFGLDDLNEDFILNVEQTQKTKVNATVQVAQTRFYSSGLFYRDEQTSYFYMYLRYENNEWKIKDGEDYWCGCWSNFRLSCDKNCN